MSEVVSGDHYLSSGIKIVSPHTIVKSCNAIAKI